MPHDIHVMQQVTPHVTPPREYHVIDTESTVSSVVASAVVALFDLSTFEELCSAADQKLFVIIQ